MSVLKSKRKKSTLTYLREMTELRIMTIRIVKKFSKMMMRLLGDNLIKLVTEAFTDCIKADNITVKSNSLPEHCERKLKYLSSASDTLRALSAEITFCHAYILEDRIIHESSEEIHRKLLNWNLKVDCVHEEICNTIRIVKEQYRQSTRLRSHKDKHSELVSRS